MLNLFIEAFYRCSAPNIFSILTYFKILHQRARCAFSLCVKFEPYKSVKQNISHHHYNNNNNNNFFK